MPVKELQQTISSSEFSEWCMYLQLEPSVEERVDFHLSRMYQLFLASKGIKDTTDGKLPWDARKSKSYKRQGRNLPSGNALLMKMKHAMGMLAKLKN